jgi:hypothetical protein
MAQSAQLKKSKKRRIAGGVDTHGDTHHAAVMLLNGARIADAEFPATATGYALLLAWLRSFGRPTTTSKSGARRSISERGGSGNGSGGGSGCGSGAAASFGFARDPQIDVTFVQVILDRRLAVGRPV